jgi:hypothetical protein
MRRLFTVLCAHRSTAAAVMSTMPFTSTTPTTTTPELISSLVSTTTTTPLSWPQLEALAPASEEPDTVRGATSARARLRLFGDDTADDVRVTLFRDHHGRKGEILFFLYDINMFPNVHVSATPTTCASRCSAITT